MASVRRGNNYITFGEKVAAAGIELTTKGLEGNIFIPGGNDEP